MELPCSFLSRDFGRGVKFSTRGPFHQLLRFFGHGFRNIREKLPGMVKDPILDDKLVLPFDFARKGP
jgi:hypothetical protein